MSATTDTCREGAETGQALAGRRLRHFESSDRPAQRIPQRRVVLHADDFGMNAAVTDGILRGFDEGILTATSLLSNAPDAVRALDCWRHLESRRRGGGLQSAARRRRLDDPQQPFNLGVHLNLTQGRPMSGARYPAELLDRNGLFPGIFSLFRRLRRATRPTIDRIEEELTCQVQFMLDHGHRPSHLNGHQYVELLPPIGSVVKSLLDRFGITTVRVAREPSWLTSFMWPGVSIMQWLLGGAKRHYAGRFQRWIAERNAQSGDAFFGTMTAGTTTAATIGAFLSASRGSRLTEIGLHPAREAGANCHCAEGWQDPLAARRPKELGMILSADLENRLWEEGCGLARLN
jgi:predicted glycoside hydrolase/deacetylase ChbG (UPF0249 family)